MFGFYRLAAAVPQLRCGDVVYNLAQLQTLYRRAAELGAAAVVFPELSITGYTCGDLFQQERLQRRALEAALTLAETTAGSGTVAIFGLPVVCREALFNTAAIAQGGKIRGLVPKSYLPNYREFYEKRQFTSGFQLAETEFQLEGRTVPFGLDLLFEAAGTPFCFGVEICEDLWSVLPPSSTLALRGARLLFNLSASPELATKAAYRRELVRQQSARTLSAYVLAAAGVHESTSDVVFGGQALIADNGRLLAENQRFQRRNDLIAADVDLQRLGALRQHVIDAHGHGVNADRIVLVHLEGQLELGAHAVGAAYEHRLLHIQGREVEHPAESADVAHHTRTRGRSHVLLDAPHHFIPGFEIHAGLFITLSHSNIWFIII